MYLSFKIRVFQKVLFIYIYKVGLTPSGVFGQKIHKAIFSHYMSCLPVEGGTDRSKQELNDIDFHSFLHQLDF